MGEREEETVLFLLKITSQRSERHIRAPVRPSAVSRRQDKIRHFFISSNKHIAQNIIACQTFK